MLMDPVLRDLIDFCRQPLAREPRWSLREWIAFLRGKLGYAGIPIPKEELPVGATLRHALLEIGSASLQLAAERLLSWIRSGKENCEVMDVEVALFTRLLDIVPELASLFVLAGRHLRFRDDVSEARREETVRQVRAHYQPMIRR